MDTPANLNNQDDQNRIMLKEENKGYTTTLEADQSAIQNWYYPGNFYNMRLYQYKLIRTALTQNTFVSLPTGTGKTFIATGLILNFYKWFPDGKIYFFAPTKALVTQQLEAVKNMLPEIDEEDIVESTGNTNAQRRKSQYTVHRIFFMTPIAFSNDLDKKAVPIQQTALIIFDEAHNQFATEHYQRIVRKLHNSEIAFRILALSATPSHSIKSLQRLITNLKIAKLKVCDEKDPDLEKYIHEKYVQTVRVDMTDEMLTLSDKMDKLIKSILRPVARLPVLNAAIVSEGAKFHVGLSVLLHALEEMTHNDEHQQLLIRTYGLIAYYGSIKRIYICMALLQCKDQLTVHGLNSFQLSLDKFKETQLKKAEAKPSDKDIRLSLFETQEYTEVQEALDYAKITGIDHPKLSELAKILIDYFESNADSKVIIFA